ncbi:MAG: AAA family ATPase [Thaumarchaeota archaeon]|nr:AAA family ATPase [Nitrososphaerota archaeon]
MSGSLGPSGVHLKLESLIEFLGFSANLGYLGKAQDVHSFFPNWEFGLPIQEADLGLSSLNSRNTSTLRESPEADLPLIGREPELSKLMTLIQESLGSSKGDIAFISGEAGIGKTRLAQELRKIICGQSNVRYLAAKSMRGESLSPYTPWIEFIREFVSQANVQLFYKVCAGDVNQIVRLVPELANAAQVTPASLVSSPESAGAERLSFFKSISQFFTRLSEESPMLLLLDDAQWADRASIHLLDYFITNALRDHPIFILCLFRDNELESVEDSPLSNLIANLKRRSPDSIIHLRRFDSFGVRALTDLSLAEGRASDDLVRVIQQTSGGNPFFLLQIVRSLVEGERIFRATDDTWQRKPDTSIQIPPAVKSVIRQRLNGLRADTRNILSIASVVGEVFELGTLRAVAENHTEESIQLGLEEAVRSSFVFSSATKTYAFQDEAVRDVALEELSTEQRKRVHQKVGVALEKIYANRAEEHAAELAGHFTKSGESKKAVQYSFKAGERAGAVYAHEVAAKHYRNSLQLLKPGEDLSMRAQILEKLSDELELSGEIEDALRWLNEAAETFEKIGEKKRAGGSYRKLAYMSLLSFEHHDNTLLYFKKALSILEQEPPSPELAYLYSDIGVEYIWRGDWQKVAEWSNKSLRLSRELKYPM